MGSESAIRQFFSRTRLCTLVLKLYTCFVQMAKLCAANIGVNTEPRSALAFRLA